MKRRIFILILATGFSAPVKQKAASSSIPRDQFTTHYYFAYGLSPGPNSSLVTFAVLSINDAPASEVKVLYLTRDDFLRQVTGFHESKANPGKENLFVKHEIHDCSIITNNNSIRSSINCSIIDDLWKLRYGEHPHTMKDKEGRYYRYKGWAAGKDFPSEGQIRMLQQFGINRMSDFFYGDNAFRLLKAIQDPAWISRYISG